MTENQLFFIKTLDIMPVMSRCEFNWYTDDYTSGIVEKMNNILSIGDCDLIFYLSEENKVILQNASRERSIEYDIYRMEVNHMGVKLFVAYDGFEIGQISPTVIAPEDYIEEFVNKRRCCVVIEL